MKAIGFRAEPQAFLWAVVEASSGQLILIESGKSPAPRKYDEAQSLAWFRNEVRSLIDQFKPEKAAVRFPESNARKSNSKGSSQRLRIEGVILEAAQSKALSVITGPLATLTCKLNSKSAKAYLESEDFRGIDWSKISKNEREAILAAGAALGELNAD